VARFLLYSAVRTEQFKESKMAKTSRTKAADPSLLTKIADWIAKGAQPLLRGLREDLEDQVDHYARSIEKRVLWLVLCGSTLFLCVVLTLISTLFILIDYCAFSRGIACLFCGLFAVLLLSVFLRSR
jgi:hypothetical protein